MDNRHKGIEIGVGIGFQVALAVIMRGRVDAMVAIVQDPAVLGAKCASIVERAALSGALGLTTESGFAAVVTSVIQAADEASNPTH